jgi:hypothetical protein
MIWQHTPNQARVAANGPSTVRYSLGQHTGIGLISPIALRNRPHPPLQAPEPTPTPLMVR